jgi:hypothetical protein
MWSENVTQHYVSGMRVALSRQTWSGGQVCVLDFHPGRLSRFCTKHEPGNGERTVVRPARTKPTIVKGGTFFSRDFESHLAYMTRRGYARANIIIDDEWIAQIMVCLSDYNVADMRF